MALYKGGQKVTPIVVGSNNSVGRLYVGNRPVSFLRNYKRSSGELHTVRVIDLDGTLLDEQQLNEGDTYTLPTAPSHPCLTFGTWSSTKSIVDNTITVGKTDVTVGAMYYPTISSLAPPTQKFVLALKLYANQPVTLSVYERNSRLGWMVDFQIYNNYNGKLSYSSTESSVSFTATETGVYYVPVYLFEPNSGYLDPISSSSILQLFSNSSSGYNVLDLFGDALSSVVGIIFPTISGTGAISLSSGCGLYGTDYKNGKSDFSRINLEFVNLPYNAVRVALKSASLYATYSSCYSPKLKVIICPPSADRIQGYPFDMNNSYNQLSLDLEHIVIPAQIYNPASTINTVTFSNSKMKSFHVDKRTTAIGSMYFYNCTACLEYDFTDFESVPALSGTDAFYGINPNCKIKVPASLEADWKAANNWSTYANYIVGV